MFNPIEMRRRMVQERIEKSFDNEIEKAHKDGDIHPNGKWVWRQSANGGKGDWRTINGRAHQKNNAAQGSASKTLTTDEKYVAATLAGKLVSNDWDYKPMKWSDIFKKVAKFPDAQVNHFAISAIQDALNEDSGDDRNRYLKGAEDALVELKYKRNKKDVSIVNYLNNAFDGYSVGGSLSNDKKKELDKFVNSSNNDKKSNIEKKLINATPQELKYIMVSALNRKVSNFDGDDMEGINHIIQEGIYEIKKNEGLSNSQMINWYMLLDKDSEKPKDGSSKSDNS